MRRYPILLLCALASCDQAGPEDVPAQLIEVRAAPTGPRFPTDTLADPLVIRVTDLEGNPVAGAAISWTASHGGTLIPHSSVTDAEGMARATWVLGLKPGTQTATAGVSFTDLSIAIPVVAQGWPVKAISSSRGWQICVIDLADHVYCWESGESPQRLETALQFTVLATGEGHTCGLSGGQVYCWGENYAGQIGDGTTEVRTAPTSPLLPSVAFKSVVAGTASTCAVTLEGEAWCWGYNLSGQLGRGSTSAFEAVPARVNGGGPWRSVSISGFAACGVSLDGGQVSCWGEGDPPGTPNMLSPVPVAGLPPADTVALSDWARCALVQTALYCWGHSAEPPALLSNGILSISAGYKPFHGLGSDGLGYYWGGLPNSSYGWGDPPAAFEGGLRLSAVAGNDLHPCALELDTGSLFCWHPGDLTNPQVTRPIRPYPVRPP